MRRIGPFGRRMQKTLGSADYEAFLELLIAARHDAGLVQQEVAKRLGRPQSFVAKYENGERRLDIVEFTDVARALKADPLKLFKQYLAGRAAKAPAGDAADRRKAAPRAKKRR